jgi:ABC-type lipoprotein release transport system permease subunit
MSPYFVRLCWKNIWRNKRRTLITVNAIGVGVMALVGIYNYYDSFHEQVIHNVIRYNSGHIVVTAPGFQEENLSSRYLKNTSEIEAFLAKDPRVKAVSPRVLAQGMLSSPRGSASILFTGIDPVRERKITRFGANLVEGEYLKQGSSKAIVIGKGLARLLKIKLGEKVVALTQGVDGSVGNDLFYVGGIFETQSNLDKTLAFVTLEDARTLLSLSGKHAAHQLAVVLKQESDLPLVQRRLKKVLPASEADILSWMEIQRPLMAMIELNKSANRLLMIVILFIAAMGIANSILMSILERTREFGVMMAIGTTKREVIKMVIVETLFLSVVGVVLGNVFGIGLTLYFNQVGFDLAWLTSQKIVVEGTIIQTVSYPTVQLHNSLVITLSILVLSLLVSFIPVRHIAGLNTVKALRSH